MRVFVDRYLEMSCVDKLVRDNEYDRRMAIVYAVDGMGKTTLLKEIDERYREDTAVASIDLGQEYEPLSLVDDMADQLESQGLRLPAYRSYRRAAPTALKVVIKIIQSKLNKSPINVAIDNTKSSHREARDLLRELISDIETTPGLLRRLVLIDRCEAAAEPLKNWLTTSFIPAFVYRNAAICILAGCRELSLSYPQERRTDRLSLHELDREAVIQWLDAAGVHQPRELASLLWQGTLGVPGDIDKFITNLKSSSEG